MNTLTLFDLICVRTIETACHRFERVTGKTNFFWLKLLTGFFAAFLMLFVLLDEMHHVSQGTFRNVIIFAMCGYSFYLSFFYSDNALAKSKGRATNKEANPARESYILMRIRLSMLTSIVLLFVSFGFLALSFPERIGDTVILVYMAVSSLTAILIWACLLLDACDPLPQTQHPT